MELVPGPSGWGHTGNADFELQHLHWRASIEQCPGGCLVLLHTESRAGCQTGAVQ